MCRDPTAVKRILSGVELDSSTIAEVFWQRSWCKICFALLHIPAMWSDHERLLFMSTPRYLKESTSSSTESPGNRVCRFSIEGLFLESTMYLHLVGFNCRRCSSDQSLTVLMSDYTAEKSSGCNSGR